MTIQQALANGLRTALNNSKPGKPYRNAMGRSSGAEGAAGRVFHAFEFLETQELVVFDVSGDSGAGVDIQEVPDNTVWE